MPDESFDPSMNILHRPIKELDTFFIPKTVAVIGATEREGSVGRTLVSNLMKTPFEGKIYPVNPKRSTILDLPAYKDLKSIPEKIELAVIVTPAKIVPSVIQECADAKIPCAIVISAGFKELGAPGIELEEQILKIAKSANMRLIGPNCLGVMNPIFGLNATFAADMATAGNLAFISQSGALLTAVLDWSLKEKVGFSSVVSIGSMVDVDWGDLITYFGNDPNTKSILIYMESIGDPRSFLSAAREVALTKPIILIKAGRSEESAKAAASHTGSLSGSDDVLNAALRRVGVLRVDSISDLFSMAQIFSKQPRPKGPHLTIVTNAGGPGVIATDALIENKAKLAPIEKKTFEALNQLLPPQWSRNNPVDILGDASPQIYGKVVDVLKDDPESNGILVILTPQDMTDPTQSAKELIPFKDLKDKPIFASWMGADIVAEGMEILSSSNIPTFEYPDDACKAFAYMWRYSYNLKGIYETPAFSKELTDVSQLTKRKETIEKILIDVRKENRELLTEFESKKILEAYDIPTVTTEIATSSEEAAKTAEKIGYPVVLKLHSKSITHKTDVGGVKLNLNNDDAVKKAYSEIEGAVKQAQDFLGVTVQPMIKLEGYELILGSSIDAQFGPVLLFGMGGQLVEVFKDRALALPPLSTPLARRMMEQTKIYTALKGVRGRESVNLEQLENLIVRFSHLISEEPWIKECDINPLLVSSEQIIALDARIIMNKPDEIPKLSIRPYPIQYVSTFKTDTNDEITLRPIRPEDESLIVQFHKDLSEETIRQRYLKVLHYDELTAHDRLIHICFNDYDREIALIAIKDSEILGVCRLSKINGTDEATFALIVKDKWQNKKIGFQLLEKVITIAKQEKIKVLTANLLSENVHMQKLCKRLGFSLQAKDTFLFAKLDL